jgi:hypothetical protein
LTCFSLFLVPISELQHALLTPEVLQIKECTLTPSFFVVFTFGFAFEYFKEFGGASKKFKKLQELLNVEDKLKAFLELFNGRHPKGNYKS